MTLGDAARPSLVSLSDIETDPQTYQFRRFELTESHLQDLVSHLKQGLTLDPMALWRRPEDGKLVVADGHHRLAAYRRVDWSADVPVIVHECGRWEARLLALSENAKARLLMSREEKADAAWRLVCAVERGNPVYSKSTIVALGLVSDGQVGNMRRVRRRLLEAEAELPERWWKARQLADGMEPSTGRDVDAWIADEADRLDDQIGKVLGFTARRCPDAVRTVLERRLGRLVCYPVANQTGLGQNWVAQLLTPRSGRNRPTLLAILVRACLATFFA